MSRSFDVALAKAVQKHNAQPTAKPTLRQRCQDALYARLGDWVLSCPIEERNARPGEAAALWIPGRPFTPNHRAHWAAKSKITRKARYDVAMAWVQAKLPLWCKPVRVVLTQVSAKELDADNSIAALKPYRDEIAELCAFNDREKLWTYAQTTGAEVGVRVEVVWP